MVQTIKRLPTMRETRVCSLGSEDPLEKEVATHSSVLAWRISWTEDPGGLQSMGSQRIRHAFTFTFSNVWGIHPPPSQNNNQIRRLCPALTISIKSIVPGS